MARTDKAVVANGRTVFAGDKRYGPGAEVSLPAEEIATLRSLGFVVDPDAKAAPASDGPTFDSKEGPSVQVAS